MKRSIMFVAVALIVAACGGDASPAATTTSSAPTSTTTATTTSTTAATTTTSSTTSSTTTTQPPGGDVCDAMDDELQGPLANHLYLDSEGLGLFAFGADPESTIIGLSCLLGEPDMDSGWTGSFSVYGTCPGIEIRGVHWGPLTVLFGDADSGYAAPGDRHIMNWRYDEFAGPDIHGLVVPETLLGLGTTVAELDVMYPGVTYDSFFDIAFFDTGTGIGGSLTGFGPDDTVMFLEAGVVCGE